jgi:hypothetical protein
MFVMVVTLVNLDTNRRHRVVRSPATVVVTGALIVLRVVPVSATSYGAGGRHDCEQDNPEGEC